MYDDGNNNVICVLGMGSVATPVPTLDLRSELEGKTRHSDEKHALCMSKL